MYPLKLFGNLTQSKLIELFVLINFGNRTQWNQKNCVRVQLSSISNSIEPIELNQTFQTNTQSRQGF